MTDFAELKENLTTEFSPCLKGMSVEHIGIFFDGMRMLLDSYVGASQLDRRMYLVLDNSIIQDFKHRAVVDRRMRALAFLAICRFAKHWSDLPVCLALSPVAIYEHGGRRPATSALDAHARLQDLGQLLGDCALRITSVGFDDLDSLYLRLLEVHADADYLEVFANQIEASDWQRNLKAPHGGEHLAIALAERAIPEDMPLKYFSPHYIRQVFRSRIEMRIAKQSQGVFGASPIVSGAVTASLSKLNTLDKRGVLKGLGDIDLLQICDISYQYSRKVDFLMLGLTFDGDLAEALRLHDHYIESHFMMGGGPDVEQKAEDLARFMFSNPFSEQDRNLEKMAKVADEFLEHMWHMCRLASLAREGA